YNSGSPGTLELRGNQASNVAYTLDAESGHWKPATDVFWLDEETPADIYGYYPYDNSLASVDAYPLELSEDQAAPGEYEASDFLWAVAPAAVPGKPVSLTFRHVMAGVQVDLRQGNGFAPGEWESLDRIVAVASCVRGCEINLASGSVQAVGKADRPILMNPDSPDSYRAVVVPQRVEAGNTVISITIDGVPYNYVRDGGMDYSGGKLHKFTMRVDRNEATGKYAVTLTDSDICEWEADRSSHNFEANSYLVVHCAEAGTLKAAIAAAGADYRTVKNLKVTGTLDWTDFKTMRNEMEALTALNLKEVRVVNAITDKINGSEVLESAVNDCLPIDALSDKASLRRLILPEGITRIGNNALAHLRLTSTLIIPESVKVFDPWCFQCIGDEATIVLPNSYESVGDCAFYGCAATFELKLPSTLKHIGSDAFMRCVNAYGTFALPPGLEYLGGGAFNECGRELQGDIVIPVAITDVPRICPGFANGTNLILHEGVRTISDDAFSGQRFNSPVVFPSGLERIGYQAFAFCRFAGNISLPAGLRYIGERAFMETNTGGDIEWPANIETTGSAFNCTSVSSVVIGNNVLQIGSESFSRNHSMRTVRIGANVEYVGPDAFSDCPALQTMVCMAKTPPRATADAFSGIYFDKCVLEVPAGSVSAYRNADGWKQFLNITEHHELAVNLPEISCLDKGVTRSAMVRAEGSWRVSSCPSWVRVEPSQGNGKGEITIEVEAMAASASSREDEIVFTLDGKDYSTYTTVRQLSADHGEDVEQVLQQAWAGGSDIPLFIVGEGFTADRIADGTYAAVMRSTMEQFFAIEPYRSLRGHFRVSTAYACSPDEGVGDVATMKNTCFNTDGTTPDEQALRSYIGRVSPSVLSSLSRALVIVVCNYNSFSGSGTICDDGLAIAAIGHVDEAYPYDQRGLVQHFAGGEAFAGLGNEGVGHFHHIKGCPCPMCSDITRFNSMKQRGYFENLSMSGKMSDAPWRDFIFHPNYSAVVDMWEGGYNHSRGVWRSEANSVMNTYISYFNAISRYTIYRSVMRRAGLEASLEHFISIDKYEPAQ
ncbi:MAG: leucine-rich repeat protein, partial [Muribaculaceae bacterium]|nr:leucine-rich repeat protein [Muribaculaceae bacterium]